MKRTEKKAKWMGLAACLISTAVALLILIFSGLYRPFPPPPEYGMEVNLGYSDYGMGDNQAFDPMASPARPQPAVSAPDDEAVMNAEDDEAPAMPKVQEKPKPKPQPKPETVKQEAPKEEVTEQPKEPELNPLALYPGKRKGTDNSQQGETGKPGDQGKPTGDVNAKGYAGNGGSGGISFSLNGRTLKTLVKPDYNSEEEGIVVVMISVNRAGKVVHAEAGAPGTTTLDANLWRTAERAALNSAFEPKESAAEVQRGKIQYRFVRNNK